MRDLILASLLLAMGTQVAQAKPQSTQVKDAGPDQQGLLVMNLCGLGLDCRGFDRPARWL